ncbi:MAG: hypothetical protein Q7S98_02640 [Deltaproteobacteria bacterium]|nr:hypothetical protein [Deltaproteobacteria bacterium]
MALKTKYSLLSHFSVENLYNSFVALSPQNRLVAMGVGGFVVILLVLLPISIMSSKVGSLQREIGSSQDSVRQIAEKLEEYQKLKEAIDQMERSLGVGISSLPSAIETVASKNNLRSNLDSLRGKPNVDTDFLEGQAVELKLSRVSLTQLVDFLYSVENYPSGLMKITKIQIRPMYSNRALLDVSLEIANYTLKKGT